MPPVSDNNATLSSNYISDLSKVGEYLCLQWFENSKIVVVVKLNYNDSISQSN